MIPTDNMFCLAAGWEAAGFDDSGWSSGPGGFTGGETTAATVTSLAGWLNTSTLPAPTALGGRPYYFRTHFTLGSTNDLSLIFTNRIDDQAVWYINGVRVWDLNHPNLPEVCVPGGAGGGEATTNYIFSLTPAQLGGIINPNGDNVLAVSVHQNGPGSSDMVFATAVASAVSAPPTIDYPSSSLTNRSVAQCIGSTTLSVTASGSPAPTYQWTHAGTNLPGATAATLAINNAQPAQAGTYQVIVSNVNGVVTSTPATVVTVIADTTPPTVRYVYAGANLTNVTIVFSEAIDIVTPSLGDMRDVNLQITDTNTLAIVTILDVVPLAGNLGYVLHTDPLNPSHGYEIYVSASQDACASLQMTDVTVPVYSFHSTPLPLGGTWRYLDNDIDPAANWPQNAFDDSLWSSAAGPFDSKRNAGGPGINCRPGGVMTNYFTDGTFTVPETCILLTSPVSGTNLVTAYFRAHFNYTGNTNATILELSGKFDDGGVVYLNGIELVRYGMAAGVVTDATFATRGGGDADREDVSRFYLPALLRSGDNVIAVDVHQANLTSSDMTMGLTVNALTLVQLATPARLRIVEVGANITITWTGGGTLQSSTDISSPANWANVVPAATSPYTTSAAGAKKFYRVTVP